MSEMKDDVIATLTEERDAALRLAAGKDGEIARYRAALEGMPCHCRAYGCVPPEEAMQETVVPCARCAALADDRSALDAALEKAREGGRLRSQAIPGTRHWAYAPCSQCGAIEGMGLSSQRSQTVAVWCCHCGHFGPTVEGLSKESDREAVMGWNAEFSRAFAERDSLRAKLAEAEQKLDEQRRRYKDELADLHEKRRELEAKLAEAERKLALYDSAQAGKAPGIVRGLHEFAERRCGHSPLSSKPPLSAIEETIDKLTAQVERLRDFLTKLTFWHKRAGYTHEKLNSLFRDLDAIPNLLAETPEAALEAHDREVRRKVLEEAAERAGKEAPTCCWYWWEGWLRDLAAKEKEGKGAESE